ncbi:MAG: hypothetical protein CSA52_02795 [Gammaproteobacteria bacterium]|nr:MAG: hypothetical protein CSB48_04465 [Pseudomonadota bacterium]PIE38328.1 MAG: hypothetical protein CSA52_02795 [Gammaproteobacteria bacterium]
MKLLHHNFETRDQFLKELQLARISLTDSHILVQVFDGRGDIERTRPLLRFIKETLPHCVLVGATTDGEILDNRILENSLLISVISFEKTRLQIEKSDNSSGNFFDEGARLGQKLQKKDLQAVILLGEGLSVNGEDLLAGFESQVGDIVIAGGLSADNYYFHKTHLFYQDQILDKGAVAVGLYSKTLRAETRSAFDCDILNEKFVVTESQGNTVHKINGIPPESLYKEYLGLHKTSQFIPICAQIPMVVNRGGDILARAAVKRHPDGAMSFAGNLLKGETVRLGMANVEKILLNCNEIYNEIHSQWDAICMYSCTGRKAILGDKLTLDIQHFPKIAPVSGFFSYGEFVKGKGERARFCNHTMVLFLLSESENTSVSSLRDLSAEGAAPVEGHGRQNRAGRKPHNKPLKEQILLVEHKNKIREQLLLAEYKNRIMGKMLYNDSLTGLRNRASLLQEIEDKKPRGVLLIDIRNFHTINDLYGESVGNLILRYFAGFLQRHLQSQHIYRLSGNTFAYLNTYNRPPEVCLAVANKIANDVQAENFYFEKGDITLECDLSVAIGISNEVAGKDHLEHADMALNYAKRNHKNIVLYSDSLNIKQGYEKHLGIIKMVKKALDDDRVIPFFQPIFQGQTVSYYESLIRIRAEDGTVLSPARFLDVVKNTSYYSRLTRRMIKKSFMLFEKLDGRFAINLSFLDFLNTGTMEYLISMIKTHHVGEKLIVEILESEVFQDYEAAIEQIRRVRSLGVKIAIDDFGSGYSNFVHLTLINPDYIKIDGTLVKDIDTNVKSLAICKAIIGFARDLNMQTVAEFIHSKEIFDITTRLKVDKHQGFYLGEPGSAEELFHDFLSKDSKQ